MFKTCSAASLACRPRNDRLAASCHWRSAVHGRLPGVGLSLALSLTLVGSLPHERRCDDGGRVPMDRALEGEWKGSSGVVWGRDTPRRAGGEELQSVSQCGVWRRACQQRIFRKVSNDCCSRI